MSVVYIQFENFTGNFISYVLNIEDKPDDMSDSTTWVDCDKAIWDLEYTTNFLFPEYNDETHIITWIPRP